MINGIYLAVGGMILGYDAIATIVTPSEGF
jgi:hypothetical protein